MRTTVEIDDELWEAAQAAADAPTKRTLIEAGLRALVDQAARRRAIALKGTLPGIEAPSRRRFQASGDPA